LPWAPFFTKRADVLKNLELIKAEAERQIRAATDPKRLEELRVEFLGRRGRLTELLRRLGKLSPEERPAAGALANEVKTAIQKALTIRAAELSAPAKREVFLDHTLPGRRIEVRRRHPVNQVIEELVQTFCDLGFTVAEGPLIETEHYNFDALNTPPDHPVRDEKDTLFLRDFPLLLRTETSPVQVRTMEKTKPPVRVIAPGRCYRNDTADARHHPVFHQIEGLWVDEGISFAHLKGILLEFAKSLFGPEAQVRFRPHFFPFTEPSAEIEATCPACAGGGCRVCSNTGWIELGGAGMVDPAVLAPLGIDPEIYTGFAFGIGPERIAMVRYGVSDIRLFYENDLRFLRQF
jgi:phenylalanyl-tRNA synthetase alpha chain